MKLCIISLLIVVVSMASAARLKENLAFGTRDQAGGREDEVMKYSRDVKGATKDGKQGARLKERLTYGDRALVNARQDNIIRYSRVLDDISIDDKPVKTTQAPKSRKMLNKTPDVLDDSDFLDVSNVVNQGRQTIKEFGLAIWDWSQPVITNYDWNKFQGATVAQHCSFSIPDGVIGTPTKNIAQCVRSCSARPTCTHFALENGKCFLLDGPATRDDAIDSVDKKRQGLCGFVGIRKWGRDGNGNFVANSCNFPDDSESEEDLIVEPKDDCTKLCSGIVDCTHWVAKPGKCIIKKGIVRKVDAFFESLPDTRCGLLKSSCENAGFKNCD